MRPLLAVCFVVALAGCGGGGEWKSGSDETVFSPDGSRTETSIQIEIRNGKSVSRKTETTVTKDGKTTVRKYEKQGEDEWIPVELPAGK
jgi:hypothetical protein